MYQRLTPATLRDGRQVEAGVVLAPDAEWAEIIGPLLMHKGGLWNWQIEYVLTHEAPIEARFYMLLEEGKALSHVMTLECAGVGIFGHVWTIPAARGLGASSELITRQMADFSQRGGRALYLGTDYQSTAYRIYHRVGFRSVEAQTGYMHYFQHGEARFAEAYWRSGPVAIEPFGWNHYPLLQPLFLTDDPAIVRNVGMHNIGRVTAEEHPLRFLQPADGADDGLQPSAQANVLVDQTSGAVAGFASWSWHPLWFDVCIVDTFCKRGYWEHGGRLFDSLALPHTARRVVSYVDSVSPEMRSLLTERDYVPHETRSDWVAGDAAGTYSEEITLWVRQT